MSDWLDTVEAGELMRMSRDYVARQCALGNIRAKRLGREWRIARAELERFMESGVKAEPTRPGRARAS